jgi:hypothetical protein
MNANRCSPGSVALQPGAGAPIPGYAYLQGATTDLREFTYFPKVPATADDTGGQEPRLRETTS